MGYETGITFLKITAQLVDCDKKDLGVTPGYNRSEEGLTEQETADKIRDNLSNERKTCHNLLAFTVICNEFEISRFNPLTHKIARNFVRKYNKSLKIRLYCGERDMKLL